MRKYANLEISTEEAEVLTVACTCYLEQATILQLRVPTLDFNFKEIEFIKESLRIMNESISWDMDTLLQCPLNLKWVYYSLATLMATLFWREDQEHHVSQCIIKLLYASMGGA